MSKHDQILNVIKPGAWLGKGDIAAEAKAKDKPEAAAKTPAKKKASKK